MLFALGVTGTRCHAWPPGSFPAWGKMCVILVLTGTMLCIESSRNGYGNILMIRWGLKGLQGWGFRVVTVTLSPQSPDWMGLVKGWILNASNRQWGWIENRYSPRLLFWCSSQSTCTILSYTLLFSWMTQGDNTASLALASDWSRTSEGPPSYSYLQFLIFNITVNKHFWSCAQIELLL